MNEDMPWVNLTQEEVEELRKQKHKLTEYGKEKLKKLMNKEDSQPFYQFFVIDYFGTGEGRTIFMQISRSNSLQYPEDYFQKRWEKFVDVDFYLQGTEELTEEEFMKRYSSLISERIHILMKDKVLGIWQTHHHFNYC